MESCCPNKCSSAPSKINYNIQRVSPPLELGEGPHWHQCTQSLYFVDLHKKKINKYHPETSCYTTATIDCCDPLTFIIPVDNQSNTFLVGLGPAIGIVRWNGCSNTAEYRYLKTVDKTPGNRLNDAKADASGRLWVGSMGPEIDDNSGQYHKCRGSLYSVDFDGTVTKRLPNISISNGMAWSPDNKFFYYIDTYKYAVEAYNFDLASGNISNGKVIFDFRCKNITGDPDGMTIDTDGNLWVACFNSNHIIKINPNTSSVLTTIEFPAYQITSAAFGGPNLDQLYVTTASYQTTDAQKSKLPYSGTLFRVLGTCSTGFNGVPVKINLCALN
ncbi:hypothetical protein AGLY_012668 [Aphis glycines]|uniref:Regucalcin n=1 Tax=Aphis glycines TaxID=307491 RepID=A0A6G0TAF9_APHGL|nr:hypothetical protein AGLY_012668 [Aphis glycines]